MNCINGVIGRKLCSNKECKSCFQKSFASIERSSNWDYILNKCNPREVFKNSHKKYYFICDKCHHSIMVQIGGITLLNQWCGYCENKKLCGKNDCDYCFKKSFASHPRLSQWADTNIGINPRLIFLGSKKSYNFNCVCGHDLHLRICDIKKGYWCGYCSSRKMCPNEDCIFCFKKSFASHPKSVYWNDINHSPRSIFKNCNKKYEFICEKGHIFKKSPSVVVIEGWCPNCRNKTELKLINWVIGLNFLVIHQFKPEWCRSTISNWKLPFDLLVENINIIIEIDGPQHFRQLSDNWENFRSVQIKDLFKMKKAYDNNFTVIRIPFEYIHLNNNFEHYQKELLSLLYKRDKPEIIYICDDDRYSHFKNFDFDKDVIPELIKKSK